jgi:hypothetical protein
MAKIARSTCTECHRILPRTQMQQVEESYHSGNSWGFNKKGQFSGARAYTRKRKRWVCDDCLAQDNGLSIWQQLGLVFGGYLLLLLITNL